MNTNETDNFILSTDVWQAMQRASKVSFDLANFSIGVKHSIAEDVGMDKADIAVLRLERNPIKQAEQIFNYAIKETVFTELEDLVNKQVAREQNSRSVY